MRVITGTAKGRRLVAPAGLATRPTAELVKEAVFSAIQFEIPGARVLDLFAGSGQMGIEALSRGAKSCVFVDHARANQDIIRENLKRTGFADIARVVLMDAKSFLKTAGEPFDLAILDPPYQEGFLTGILPQVAQAMRPGGVIVCECDSGEQLPETVLDFSRFRDYRHGKTKIAIYRNLLEE